PSVRPGFGQAVRTTTSRGPVTASSRLYRSTPGRNDSTSGAGCGPPETTDHPRSTRARSSARSVPRTSASGWTWPSMRARRPRPRNGARTASAIGIELLEQFLDARSVRHRAVGAKVEVRRDPEVEVLAKPVTDEAPRAGQRRQRARPLALVPEHRHEDLRLAKILGRLHVGDRDEAQAGILELPLQEHRDLLFD